MKIKHANHYTIRPITHHGLLNLNLYIQLNSCNPNSYNSNNTANESSLINATILSVNSLPLTNIQEIISKYRESRRVSSSAILKHIIDVLSKIGIKVVSYDIVAVHRLGKFIDGKCRNVIIRFTNRKHVSIGI